MMGCSHCGHTDLRPDDFSPGYFTCASCGLQTKFFSVEHADRKVDLRAALASAMWMIESYEGTSDEADAVVYMCRTALKKARGQT